LTPLNGGTSTSIQSHKQTNFQSAGKYQGSNLALASRRGAASDKTQSQATTKPPMRSSSNGERKLSKSHDVQQLALCHRLPCQSARPHVISTSTNVPQLNPFLHLHRLFNRKCNVNKLTDVWQYTQTRSLHLPPLCNGPSNLLASPSPIRRPMKTRTIVGLHLHPLACRLSF
jgi:hypothetical protein